jgi:hypothetical protein
VGTTADIRLAASASDPAVTPDGPAPASAALGAAAPPPLRSEQLVRLADRTAAALPLPLPAVDHERTLRPRAAGRDRGLHRGGHEEGVPLRLAAVRRLGRAPAVPPTAGAPRRDRALRHRGRR